MANYITKCNQCGCREMCVTEEIDWNGTINRNGVLRCTNPGSSAVTVHCADCGTPYSRKHFATLEFN